MWINSYKENNYYNFAIALKEESSEPIGCISVVNIDEHTEVVSIGYCMGRNWWDKGIMTEALKIIISFMIEEVGASRVDAIHDVNNVASGKVMEKAGMVL